METITENPKQQDVNQNENQEDVNQQKRDYAYVQALPEPDLKSGTFSAFQGDFGKRATKLVNDTFPFH